MKQVCRCEAYKFPHRAGSGYCEEDQDKLEPLVTMPGLENFDSVEEYLYESTRRI